MAELFQMPFGDVDSGGPNEPCTRWGPRSPPAILGCPVTQPFVGILWPLVISCWMQARSFLASAAVELQSKAWRIVFTSAWLKTSCSCSLTPWSTPVSTHWLLNSTMGSSITPTEYYSLPWSDSDDSRHTSLICSLSTCIFAYFVTQLWLNQWRIWMGAEPTLASPVGNGPMPSWCAIMLASAKFWSFCCKTCTSEYSKWLPSVAFSQL